MSVLKGEVGPTELQAFLLLLLAFCSWRELQVVETEEGRNSSMLIEPASCCAISARAGAKSQPAFSPRKKHRRKKQEILNDFAREKIDWQEALKFDCRLVRMITRIEILQVGI